MGFNKPSYIIYRIKLNGLVERVDSTDHFTAAQVADYINVNYLPDSPDGERYFITDGEGFLRGQWRVKQISVLEDVI